MGSLKIYGNILFGLKKPLIELADPKNPIKKTYEIEKITRHVKLWHNLLKNLGIRVTCLTYSLILCRTLRAFGHDVKLNFAAKSREIQAEEKLPLAGHCWVSTEEKETTASWQVIFQYP